MEDKDLMNREEKVAPEEDFQDFPDDPEDEENRLLFQNVELEEDGGENMQNLLPENM